MKSLFKQLTTNEAGLASIMVTMILLLVISLTAIAFAKVARQELRDSVDFQLSSQAFYAAESGLNDANRWLHSNVSNASFNTCNSALTTISTTNKFTAINGSGLNANGLTLSNDLGKATAASEYTCVLIQRQLQSNEYTSVDMQKGKFANLKAFDNAGNPKNIDSLLISWKDEQGIKGFRTAGERSLPNANDWDSDTGGDSTGVLRIDLTNIAAGLGRNALINNTGSILAYPDHSGGPIPGSITFNQSRAKRGEIISGHCSANHGDPVNFPNYCSVQFTGINSTNVFLRLRSLYRSSSVTVKAFASGGALLRLEGGQALVDVTGKSSDVLRRIQANLDLSESANFPSSAVETIDSICKQLDTEPSSTASPACPDALVEVP